MGRGRFKGEPSGRRQFSPLKKWFLAFHSSADFSTVVVNVEEADQLQPDEYGDEISAENEKHKGTEGIIKIVNPNLLKAKASKAKNVDLGKTTELSRREREEVEKQKSRALHEAATARKDGASQERLRTAGPHPSGIPK